MATRLEALGWHEVTGAPDLGARVRALSRFMGRLWLWMIRPPRRLKFTTSGRIFLLMLFLVGIAGVNTGNNLLYILVGMMLGMILASGILSESALRRLSARLECPGELFAGRLVTTVMEFANTNRRVGASSVSATPLFEPRAAGKAYSPYVPGKGQVREALTLQFARRGEHRLGGISLSTDFPFGFIHKSKRTALEETWLVYPAVRPVGPDLWRLIDQRLSDSGRRGGEAAHRSRMEGPQVLGVRDWQPGDPLKKIAWKSTAKLGRLMSREFESEEGAPFTLVLESPTDSRMTPEAVEQAIAAAASIACSALEQGRAVGLLLPGSYLPPNHGRAQREGILAALALTDLKGPLADAPSDSRLVLNIPLDPAFQAAFSESPHARR